MTTDEILRRGRILMVDDEMSSLCLLENVLKRLGFPYLHKLSDATRFFEEFAACEPDLVITDLDMPGLNGIQLVEQLRASLPRDSYLPILVLTGSTDPKVKRTALMAGATDILFKPFDSSEMLMRIMNLLRTRFLHLEIHEQNRELEEKVAERTAALERAMTELTDSQRQVVQQERFRAFGEMAGGVVHDFNNTLMSVIGYSELLLQDEELLNDKELVRSYLTTMNTAGRDASHVVSRLRDFYRPREENDVFTLVDVNQILEEVVPLTRPKWHDQALQTGRKISVELELQKVALVMANAAELREVVTNLIFNAVDAMPEGGIITLRTQTTADTVQMEIADNGAGMNEEVRARCVEPFFSTKGEKGTGLGLSMSFGIIRRHEGTLEIKTAQGVGTTFRLVLPVAPQALPAKKTVQLMLDRALQILVVDDDANTRDLVAQYLRSDGHHVSTAASGVEALQHMKAGAADLLITDLGMPGMNGTQLATEVKAHDATKAVILMTGFVLDTKQPLPGVDCILKKPLVRNELRAALRKVAP